MNLERSGTILLLILFFKYLKKHTFTNLKFPGTNFLLIPFFTYLKKHTDNSEKYMGQLLCSDPFSNIWKSILTNLKIPRKVFCLYAFLNIQKSILTSLKNTWNNFYAHTLFKILKKAYLQISKIPGTIFLLIPFFKYLEKHTSKSKKYLGQFLCLYTFSNI